MSSIVFPASAPRAALADNWNGAEAIRHLKTFLSAQIERGAAEELLPALHSCILQEVQQPPGTQERPFVQLAAALEGFLMLGERSAPRPALQWRGRLWETLLAEPQFAAVCLALQLSAQGATVEPAVYHQILDHARAQDPSLFQALLTLSLRSAGPAPSLASDLLNHITRSWSLQDRPQLQGHTLASRRVLLSLRMQQLMQSATEPQIDQILAWLEWATWQIEGSPADSTAQAWGSMKEGLQRLHQPPWNSDWLGWTARILQALQKLPVSKAKQLRHTLALLMHPYQPHQSSLNASSIWWLALQKPLALEHLADAPLEHLFCLLNDRDPWAPTALWIAQTVMESSAGDALHEGTAGPAGEAPASPVLHRAFDVVLPGEGGEASSSADGAAAAGSSLWAARLRLVWRVFAASYPQRLQIQGYRQSDVLTWGTSLHGSAGQRSSGARAVLQALAELLRTDRPASSRELAIQLCWAGDLLDQGLRDRLWTFDLVQQQDPALCSFIFVRACVFGGMNLSSPLLARCDLECLEELLTSMAFPEDRQPRQVDQAFLKQLARQAPETQLFVLGMIGESLRQTDHPLGPAMEGYTQDAVPAGQVSRLLTFIQRCFQIPLPSPDQPDATAFSFAASALFCMPRHLEEAELRPFWTDLARAQVTLSRLAQYLEAGRTPTTCTFVSALFQQAADRGIRLALGPRTTTLLPADLVERLKPGASVTSPRAWMRARDALRDMLHTDQDHPAEGPAPLRGEDPEAPALKRARQ